MIVKAASDLDHADIRALFKAAIKHAGATFPAPTTRSPRSTRMIIKSASKKKMSKKKTSKKQKPRASRRA